MTTTPFLISDFREGLNLSLEPWLLPREAFPQLINSYNFRGVIRKRGGSQLLGSSPDNSRIKDNSTGIVLKGPVLGLLQREISTINAEQLIGWGANTDITAAHPNVFNNASQRFVINAASPTWDVTENTFFWGRNYFRSLWVTTNNSANPIRYTFAPTGTNPWRDIKPIINAAGNLLESALLIIPYKNRLVVFNTLENGINFRQRARWCQNGTPYIDSDDDNRPANTGSDDTAWRSDIIGKGGFIDAPIQEQIVGCDFFKDTLIVFFERSTLQLRYTGNELIPFIWDRINSEHGCESTWSVVKLEEGVVAVGYNGIVISNGVNTERIDSKIPDQVFGFGNQQQIPKVHGIRDFWAESVYWTFVSDKQNPNQSPNFPDKMLYYNYKEQTWAIFNNSYTVFSHYSSFEDRTWENLNDPNEDFWKNLSSPWNDPRNIKGFPIVVAGNQQGFVFKLFNAGPSNPVVNEDKSLQCSCVTPKITSINHNLFADDFIKVEGSNTSSDGQIFKVLRIDKDNFDAIPNLDPENPGPPIQTFAVGFLVRIENFDITTKRLNPVIEQGKTGRLVYMDIFVGNPTQTTSDKFQAELFIDNNTNAIVQALTIDPTTASGKVWKRVFLNSTGNFFTVRFKFSEDQMFSIPDITTDVRIHALMFHMRDSGGRLTK